MKDLPHKHTKLGPFIIEPNGLGSRDIKIKYYVENQEMTVEKADIKDLITALRQAYDIYEG